MSTCIHEFKFFLHLFVPLLGGLLTLGFLGLALLVVAALLLRLRLYPSESLLLLFETLVNSRHLGLVGSVGLILLLLSELLLYEAVHLPLLLRLRFLLVFATRRCFSLLPLSLELGELLSAGLLLFLPSLLHLAVVIVLRISLVSVVRRGWTSSSGSNAAWVCEFARGCLRLLAAVGATGRGTASTGDGVLHGLESG